ncbi:response regulator transcription factor [Pseudonocardia sp. GCM10023141]|uniref:response regulator transcription factor n=1 Tax=Pseudonocardia sp. GCM10023141 TaxID=3252653 RepID=UPI0036135D19
MARGHRNRDITAQMFISRRAVEVHVDHILRKLGFESGVQIAVWILSRGLDG